MAIPLPPGSAKLVEPWRGLGHQWLWGIPIARGLRDEVRREDQGIVGDASAVTPQGCHKSPRVERSLCSIPWQGDFPSGNVPTVKDALRSIHWKLDDRPISMKLYEFAAIDGPEETSAPEMHQRIIAMATEQSPRIPAKFGGTLGPVFGRVQEAMAITHELIPTVPWDVSWWTIILEAGDPLDPTDWDAPLCANW